jgi:hypothetical protein
MIIISGILTTVNGGKLKVVEALPFEEFKELSRLLIKTSKDEFEFLVGEEEVIVDVLEFRANFICTYLEDKDLSIYGRVDCTPIYSFELLNLLRADELLSMEDA